MIIEFFRYGSGLSKGPLDYLLGKDRAREHAKILSGNEQEIAGLIDSSPFAKKYTSGCLSFYEDDLSEETKQQIMAKFEQCLFPGMDDSQYRVLWIEHKDKLNEENGKKRLELNFLIPNTEIITGKRLQPFYHLADLPRVDLFKKITNFEYGLHDPNDPLFRQAITNKKSLPKKVVEIKTVIDSEALKAIEQGIVTDRTSLKKWLTDLGLEITQIKPNSISIRNPNNDDEKSRPIRLTGAIYEQDFRVTAESAELTKAASEQYRRESKQRNDKDLQRYREHIEQKSSELEQKYRQHETEPRITAERSNSANYQTDNSPNTPTNSALPEINSGHQASPTRSSRTIKSELERIQPISPTNSRSSQNKERTYQIDYSYSFNSLYYAYQQHLLRVREQKQIQRYTSDEKPSQLPEIAGGQSIYNDMRQKNVCGVRPEIYRDKLHNESRRSTPAANCEGDTLNDIRSRNLRNYRQAVLAAKLATSAARKSIEAYSNTKQNYFGAGEIQRKIDRLQRITDRAESNTNRLARQDPESGSITSFVRKLGEQLKTAITESFEAVSQWTANRQSSQSTNREDFTELSTSRNRETDKTISTGNQYEIGLSTAVSRPIRGFSTESIFTALKELDKRKEMQLQQSIMSRDSDYDSPSPF